MKLIVLDRDGVINEDSDDYIKSPEEWIAIPGSAAAIARLNQAGYQVVVATNQSGVGRGYYDLATLDAIHDKMRDTVAAEGGEIKGIFFCPHSPEEGCDCRKPKSGLIDQIQQALNTDVSGCYIVGDSARDLVCGVQRGCLPVLVRTGKGERTLAAGLPEEVSDARIHDSLADFVEALLGE